MNRREFLKVSGLGAAALATGACNDNGKGKQTVSGQPEGPVDMREAAGDKVSLLGFGCMRWPKKEDENGKSVVDREKVYEMVDYALDRGVNYFDSSPVYIKGESEGVSGDALARHPRDSYYIATKASVFGASANYEDGVKMYRRSLELYHTDYIDYYLLHALGGEDDFNKRFRDTGLMDFFLKEREAGRIRHLGFSFHGKQEGFDEVVALHEKYHWDFVQIQMNYLDWEHPGKRTGKGSHMYKLLADKDIPVVIMEPLRGGSLANVPAAIHDRLKEREPGKSAASWAFRFCGSFPKVLTVLSGMTCMEHLHDNLRTFTNLKPLTEEEMTLLEELAASIDKFPLVKCTACQYCMPCPYGIDISGIFKFYNDSVNSESYIKSAEQKHYARIRRRYLASYNKAVESVRQADHCISCGKCVPKCPQKIKIPAELSRIDKYIESVKRGG